MRFRKKYILVYEKREMRLLEKSSVNGAVSQFKQNANETINIIQMKTGRWGYIFTFLLCFFKVSTRNNHSS